ncbi:MAG: hypothetical protein M3Q95_08215 [Bacteroidota bacterium]|nr:hypothetical protein [Bacteroidota bacterium]
MKNLISIVLICLSLVLTLSSCEKQDNDLENLVLFNPYDPSSGIELLAIDSMKRNYGTLPNLRGYFHINSLIIPDTSIVQRVILYRNGLEKGRLSPGDISFFVDITAFPGGNYNYQLQLLMKDSSYTKITQPYEILF